jgi:diaminohydroxyphosphoribosylaminopyrimidine deaminase/5-amino-6-(5-phosphoribosylamino)uracil reductase
MDDRKFMHMVLELAKKGRTSPNPKVGCVIVKVNKILGTGYHKKAGESHAEIVAILDSKHKTQDLSGATMYLNLEPCCSNYPGKRKPPCLEAVLKSGVSRVVVAMEDPNPKVSGKGLQKLRKSGINVEVGLLEKEARELNKPYIKWITKKLPYVFVKVAMTLDGKIASKTGDSEWVSGKKSLEFAHELRANADAMLVGAGTIKTDNPRLTTRIVGRPNPIRIVVDSDLCISSKSKFMDIGNVIVATSKKASKARIRVFQKAGAKVIVVGERKVDLKKLMKELGKIEIQSVMLEGGSELIGSAIEAGIVDKIYLVVAPKIIGGRNAKSPVGGDGIKRMKDALKLKNMKYKILGEDLLIEAEL